MHDGYGRRGGSVFGAFLLGGIVGAVLGLLFAPRSGNDTREMLTDKAEEYWGGAGEMVSTGMDKVTDMASTTKVTASEKGEELRAKIDEARGRLQEQVAKSAEVTKAKIEEVTPVAKGAVDKAAESTKSGIDVAAEKATGGLDFVAKKAAADAASSDAAAAVAEVKAGVDEAAAATAQKFGENPLPPL